MSRELLLLGRPPLLWKLSLRIPERLSSKMFFQFETSCNWPVTVVGKKCPAPQGSKGFQVMECPPSAVPAATGNGEDHRGDTLHSHLGCRTGSALAAQASQSGKDLVKGEGRGGVAGQGGKKDRCKFEQMQAAEMCLRGF